MIALLLNSTFWIILGTVVFTALVIYFCHKSQVFAHIAKIAGIFLGVALLGGSAIYSVYQVNGYYSAEGGIIGKITNTFKPNVVNVNDFEIKIDNIELQQEFEDTYLAEITINQEIKLDSNKKYALFVNGAPTSCFASESNYIGGVYGYAFYGANNTLLLHDDLVIELALYKNYSLMFLYTMGGNTAVDYWNYYFNRNDFVITIEEIDVAAIDNNEEITGVVPEYYTVSYCVDDEVVAKQIYHPNDTIEMIASPEKEDFVFQGWLLNGTHVLDSFIVFQSIVLEADFVAIENYIEPDEQIISCYVAAMTQSGSQESPSLTKTFVCNKEWTPVSVLVKVGNRDLTSGNQEFSGLYVLSSNSSYDIVALVSWSNSSDYYARRVYITIFAQIKGQSAYNASQALAIWISFNSSTSVSATFSNI